MQCICIYANTSKLSWFQAGLFYKGKGVVSHLKHLTMKTSSFRISKMWSTIFSTSKLTEIIGILFRFKFIKSMKNRKMRKNTNIFVSSRLSNFFKVFRVLFYVIFTQKVVYFLELKSLMQI